MKRDDGYSGTNFNRPAFNEMLAGGKEVLSEEIDREAVQRGISTRTVRDAKKELGAALKSRIGEGRKKIHWME